MIKFLQRILISLVLFSTLVAGVYLILHHITMRINTYNKNCMFVWGDSQMYQGFDVELLSDKTGKQILTSARHGSGIYDFLVSEKNIPNKAICVVAFPECALLRNPMFDHNRSGFELSCLQLMFHAGCPMDECLKIANLNRSKVLYTKVFGFSHKMIPYSDSIACPEPLAGFCGMFSEKEDFYEWKAKAYMKGIQNLNEKESQLVLLQFPFEQQVEYCACNSINRHLTDSLKLELIDRFSMKYDTIVLHSDSLLMYDLSHLNEVGARLATNRVAEVMKADTINNRFIVITIE